MAEKPQGTHTHRWVAKDGHEVGCGILAMSIGAHAEAALVVATTMMNVVEKRGAAVVRWQDAPAEGLSTVGDGPRQWDHDSSRWRQKQLWVGAVGDGTAYEAA